MCLDGICARAKISDYDDKCEELAVGNQKDASKQEIKKQGNQEKCSNLTLKTDPCCRIRAEIQKRRKPEIGICQSTNHSKKQGSKETRRTDYHSAL
jgi:hypothetical protein